MRIWCQVSPDKLCGQHLRAQWFEGLGLWAIITRGKRGYANHPETKRWRGLEPALFAILSDTRAEMVARSWNPKPLPEFDQPMPTARQSPKPWDDQLAALRLKGCGCMVPT